MIFSFPPPPHPPPKAPPVIGIIAAISPDGVIGVDGKMPWHYPGDLARFKQVTMGSVVVMGRLTWESIGGRVLPGRTNVVVTRSNCLPIPERHHKPSAAMLRTAASVKDALVAGAALDLDVWFIGGAQVYEAAMPYCNVLDITYVPDRPRGSGAVYFPTISFEDWEIGPFVRHEHDPYLFRRVYHRHAARPQETP